MSRSVPLRRGAALKRVLLPLLVIILVLGLSAPTLASPAPDQPDFHALLTLKGSWGTATAEISGGMGKGGFSLECRKSLESELFSCSRRVRLRTGEHEIALQLRGDYRSPLGGLRYTAGVTKVRYEPPTGFFELDYAYGPR